MMGTFALLASLCVVIVLGILVPVFFRNPKTLQIKERDSEQSQAALEVLREQLADLKADFNAGKLTLEVYEQGQLELERRVLEEGQVAAHQQQENHKNAHFFGWALILLIPLSVGGLYSHWGNVDALNSANTLRSSEEHDAVSQEKLNEMVRQLEHRLEQEPQNIAGWQMLGRSYMVMGQFDKAVKVYTKLAQLMPKEADPLVDWAEALIMSAEGKIQEEPEKLAIQALSLNPDHPKALAIAGTGAYERKDYQAASNYWEKLLAQTPANSETAQTILNAIEDARTKGGLPEFKK